MKTQRAYIDERKTRRNDPWKRPRQKIKHIQRTENKNIFEKTFNKQQEKNYDKKKFMV